MLDNLLKQECNLEFFHTHGYVRKQCSCCKAYFWTLQTDDDVCGDRPCVAFSFINKPLTKKPFSIKQVRRAFITFFEQKNHGQVSYPDTGNRCPVIARWRNDIYLTIASIADFQPHVTSGEVPPPYNPLVISQPCIRLNDLENVGVSGRHLTMFEMMGHHAFNKNIDEVYWKEQTTAYCDEFFTKTIGIPRQNITYKEQLWVGGGNAGPCIEVLAGGLEIATLVFMNFKQDPKGPIHIEGEHYTQNPLNIVDTGYGLERIAWITQGTETVYETVFPTIIKWIEQHCEKPLEKTSIYALADHTKCLAFMLGDGIVPSNVKAGYLARLLIRRSLRFMETIQLKKPLKELVGLHLEQLKDEFPSLSKDAFRIDDMLDVETKRFSETMEKGKQLITRLIKEKQHIEDQDLLLLYDTHGIPPNIVESIAQQQGIHIKIPENFESMVAQLHSHEQTKEDVEQSTIGLPSTTLLYYQDHYAKECDAKALWVCHKQQTTECIVDQTVCYPQGGGQPGDIGTLQVQGKTFPILEVKKQDNAVLHVIDGIIQKGEIVHITINWDHRYQLMKHHTGTHLVNGALQKVLGKHVWQAGSQLDSTDARFDYTHYQPLTEEETKQVEHLANQYIKEKIPVSKRVMSRNDAEKTYGFRLYQGGVPPGNKIRVLDVPGVDVEACGGTHVDNTSEIETIQILKTERIQDGVNRVVFAAGKMVDAYQNKQQDVYNTLVTILKPYYIIQDHTSIIDNLEQSAAVFSVQSSQLKKTLQRFLKETDIKKVDTVPTLTSACQHLFNQWKQTQKNKKQVSLEDIEQLRRNAKTVQGTQIHIITAIVTADPTAIAGKLVSEPDYIVFLSDGKKIISAASDSIDIDLRKIAPILGKMIGGSGGGNTHLTQSGGPKNDKDSIDKALKEAVKLTEELLTKKT